MTDKDDPKKELSDEEANKVAGGVSPEIEIGKGLPQEVVDPGAELGKGVADAVES